MHGLVVEFELDVTQGDRAIEFLHQVVVPMVKQGAGFVSGTWMRSRDGERARNVIFYEDEQAADAAAERARQRPPPGSPTRFVSAEVFEVMAQA